MRVCSCWFHLMPSKNLGTQCQLQIGTSCKSPVCLSVCLSVCLLLQWTTVLMTPYLATFWSTVLPQFEFPVHVCLTKYYPLLLLSGHTDKWFLMKDSAVLVCMFQPMHLPSRSYGSIFHSRQLNSCFWEQVCHSKNLAVQLITAYTWTGKNQLRAALLKTPGVMYL